MADRIVIDTGPLIALARANALDVVGRLKVTFLAPEAVRDELNEGARVGHAVITAPWLHVTALRAPVDPMALVELGPGEAAVIALAREQAIEVVAIDERKGRRAALAVGLRVTGTLGLLALLRQISLSIRRKMVSIGGRDARGGCRGALGGGVRALARAVPAGVWS